MERDRGGNPETKRQRACRGYRAPLEIRKTLLGILKTKDYMAETAETSRQAVRAS